MIKTKSDQMCVDLQECNMKPRDIRWVDYLLDRNNELSELQIKELIKLYEKHLGFGRED